MGAIISSAPAVAGTHAPAEAGSSTTSSSERGTDSMDHAAAGTAVPITGAGSASSDGESLEEQKQLLKVAMQIAAHGNAPEGEGC